MASSPDQIFLNSTSLYVFNINEWTAKLEQLEEALKQTPLSTVIVKNSLVARIHDIKFIPSLPASLLDRLLQCFQWANKYLTEIEKKEVIVILQHHIGHQPLSSMMAFNTYYHLADSYSQKNQWQASLLYACYAYNYALKAKTLEEQVILAQEQITFILQIFIQDTLEKSPYQKNLLQIIDDTLHKSKQNETPEEFIQYFEKFSQWLAALHIYIPARAKELYSILDRYLSTLNKNWPTHLEIKKSLDKHLTDFQLLIKTAILSSWQLWRKQLAEARQQCSGEAFSQAIQRLLQDMLAGCVTLLGEEKGWTLIIVGSLGRKDASLYPDLEAVFLLQDETMQPYVKTLRDLFSFFMLTLGESPPGDLPLSFPVGLQIDTCQLFTLKTVEEQFNKGFEALLDNPLLWSLLTPCYLSGSKKLFDDYAHRVQTILDQRIHQQTSSLLYRQHYALLQWQADTKNLYDQTLPPRLSPPSVTVINLKTTLLKPLVQALVTLALFEKIEAQHPFDIIDILVSKKIFPIYYGTLLKQGIDFLYHLRWRAQQFYGHSQDQVCYPLQKEQTTSCYALTPQEEAHLQRIYQSVSRPLLHWMKAIHLAESQKMRAVEEVAPLLLRRHSYVVDPFTAAIHTLKTQPSSSHLKPMQMIEFIFNGLAIQKVSALDYLGFYKLLPENLRPSALQWIQKAEESLGRTAATLLDVLEDYPFQGGRQRLNPKPSAWYLQLKECLQASAKFAQESKGLLFFEKKPLGVFIQSILLGPEVQALSPLVAQQLLDDKGNFKKTGLPGRRQVLMINLKGQQPFYCKIYPELPGIEFAVKRLHDLMMGQATAETDLAKIQVGEHSYPVLLSKGIIGLPLHQALKQKSLVSTDVQVDSKAWLNDLDPKHVSQLILLALLIKPEDGKPDNYIVETGQNGEEKPVYRLLGVDNDHAFLDSVIMNTSIGGQTTLKLQTKTILFCLDQMKDALHPEAVEEFLILDPGLLLQNWLMDLKRWNEQAALLFTAQEITQLLEHKNSDQKTSVPILLKQGLIKQLYETISAIQFILKSNPTIPAIDLLVQVDPLMGSFYQKIIAQPLSPGQRFLELTAQDYKVLKDGSSLSTLNTMQTLTSMLGNLPKDKKGLGESYQIQSSIDELKIIQLQKNTLEAVKKELLAGNTKPFQALILDSFREQIVNSIDWKTLSGETTTLRTHREFTILSAMRNTSFRVLKLAYCQILDLKMLEAFIKNSPVLSVLDITGCALLNAKVIDLLINCPALGKLNLSELEFDTLTISSGFLISRPLPQLRHLVVKNNPRLKECKINLPNLKSISLKNCTKLTKLTLETPALTKANLSNCVLLSDKALLTGLQSCEQLQQLKLDGCEQITEIELKQLLPQLLQFPMHKLNSEFRDTLKRIILNDLMLSPALSFMQDYIDEIHVQVLAKALEMNTHITSLKLPSRVIHDKSAETLALLLKKNSAIIIIDIIDEIFKARYKDRLMISAIRVTGIKDKRTNLLLHWYLNKHHPGDYVPTYTQENRKQTLYGVPFEVVLVMVPNQNHTHYIRLGHLSYVSSYDFNSVIICFSVVNPFDLKKIEDEICPFLKTYPKYSIILAGTKIEKRESKEILAKLAEKNLAPVSYEEGSRMAKRIGAIGYFEYSEVNGKGITEIFDKAIMSENIKPIYLMGNLSPKVKKELQKNLESNQQKNSQTIFNKSNLEITGSLPTQIQEINSSKQEEIITNENKMHLSI